MEDHEGKLLILSPSWKGGLKKKNSGKWLMHYGLQEENDPLFHFVFRFFQCNENQSSQLRMKRRKLEGGGSMETMNSQNTWSIEVTE